MKKIASHDLSFDDLDEAIIDWFHKYGYLEDTDDVTNVREYSTQSGKFIALWGKGK